MVKIIKIKLPHTYALIFSFVVLAAILTWVVPGGQYERTTNAQGREVVQDGTFTFVEGQPQGSFALLKSPLTGIVETANIIAFILIIGGVFAVIQKTRAIDATILRVAQKLKSRGIVIIPIGMVLFSVFGAVFGMSEEVIPFVLVFIPLALALGYDSIVGVAIPFLGAGLGFAGAMFNPFTLGIAQGIAELPLFSGLGYRLVVWFVVTAAGTALVMRYAMGIHRKPESSPVYDLDRERTSAKEDASDLVFNLRHRFILLVFIVGFVLMVFGVMKYQWFIAEIAALFLGMSILCGAIAGLSVNTFCESFIEGAKDLVGAALIVGLARAILVVARDGQIIDTMLYSMSQAISRLHPILAAQSMFVIQSLINFFIPSGSGKAALTMPIMAPLADLIGITRQTAVLAYQLGDGLTNMIIPTSGVTMGVLGMAKIPWERWARWLLPIVVVLCVLGFLLLIPPVLMEWGPF